MIEEAAIGPRVSRAWQYWRITNIQRIQVIRTSALQLVKRRGEWVQVGLTTLLIAEHGPLTFAYRTPCQQRPPEEPEIRIAFSAHGEKPGYLTD
jgi:hypothetical protein